MPSMVQSQRFRMSLALVVLTSGVCAQDALPNPFNLKREELDAGNPLAQYAEMRRLQGEYLAGVTLVEAFKGMLNGPTGMQARVYAEARATAEANLGRIQESLWTQSIGEYRTPYRAPHLKSALAGMRRGRAADYLLAEADRHRWLMFGEEHMKPQTRTLLVPLLRGLRKKGFRYFAAETFSSDLSQTMRDGYPSANTGTYTKDPVFAEAVREALSLGFTLVPYDDTKIPTERPANDPLFPSNFREHAQAARLKERILDRDPAAKVLVWGGRSHVSEEAGKFPDGNELRPMAYEFRRMTGIDPLTAYLPTMTEAASADSEHPDYKLATGRGWVEVPTVFLDAKRKPYQSATTDVAIFFPRTRYIRGRPDWLMRELGRIPVAIDPKLAPAQGFMLAQAWLAGEPTSAVPVDQILLMPGDPLPALMLPRHGAYHVRVIDPSGRELGRTEVQTR